MRILKMGVLSAIVAGSAMLADAKPANAQFYFGIGTGGYYGSPAYHGHGYHAFPNYGYGRAYGGGHYHRGGFDWDDGWDRGDFRQSRRQLERDYRQLDRRFEREHRQFHRRWDRRHDWDD